MQSNLHISILEFTYLKQNPQRRDVSPKMCHWVAAMPSTGLDFQDAFTSEIWTHFTFQIDHYSMAKKTMMLISTAKSAQFYSKWAALALLISL